MRRLLSPLSLVLRASSAAAQGLPSIKDTTEGLTLIGVPKPWAGGVFAH